MRLSQLFSAAALLGVALAQADFAVLLSFPACTQQCSAEILTPVGCLVTDLRNCLCTSHDLQYRMTECVMTTCNVTEQYTSLTITQTKICNGVPHPSKAAFSMRTTIIMTAITFPIIFLRFISRMIIAHKVWWDDWTILAAAILMVPMSLLTLYPSARLGFGKHFYNVPPENLIILLKISYITQLLYVVVQTLAKMSILLLYLRIFPSQRFRLILKICLGFMVCHAIGFVFAVAFQCVPAKSLWHREIPAYCGVNKQALIYAGAGFSIFEDFGIMFLPVLELKDLNLTRQKKIAVGFMFALGSFACVTSIIRLKFVTTYTSTLDQTWDYVNVIVWSLIETYTAVICACLMCIRPLILKFMPGVFGTIAGNSRNNTDKSWGQKVGSKIRRSRGFGGAIELSGEEGLGQSQKVASTRQITITTESSVSYEMKGGSFGTQTTASQHDIDNETISSNERLTGYR